jgi:hypothetical protein
MNYAGSKAASKVEHAAGAQLDSAGRKMFRADGTVLPPRSDKCILAENVNRIAAHRQLQAKQASPVGALNAPRIVTHIGLVLNAAFQIWDTLREDTYDFSSARDFSAMLYTKQDYDPSVGDILDVTLEQLAAYIAITEQPTLAALGLLGRASTTYYSLMNAADTAASVTVPPYISMESEPMYPHRFPDDPTEAESLQPPDNFQSYYAYPWQFQWHMNQGVNHNHYALARGEKGLPCKVMVAASPLLLKSNYLWKGTHLGGATSPGSADVNASSALSYVSACLTAATSGGTQGDTGELYLGSRLVSFTGTPSETPNNVFSGSTNLTITIPDSITAIPAFAFCSTNGTDGEMPFNITSLYLNPNVRSIGEKAFYRTTVKTLYYPSTITNIGPSAFANSGLINVVAYNNTPTVVTTYDPVTINLNASTQVAYSSENLIFVNFTSATVNGTFINGNNNTLTIGIRNTDVRFDKVAVYGTAFESDGTISSIRGDNLYNMSPYPNTAYTTFFQRDAELIFHRHNMPSYFDNDYSLVISSISSATVTPSPAWTRRPPTTVSVGSGVFIKGYVSMRPRTEGTTTIGDNAFAGNTSLQTFTIPPNCTSIGTNAFSGTTNLEHIVLPDTVTTISDNAFQGSGLTQINIPTSLTSVGTNVFQDISSLNLIITADPSGSTGFSQLIAQVPTNTTIYTPSQAVANQVTTALGAGSTVTIAIDTPPNQITDVSAQALDGSVILSWNPPIDSSGSRIISYTIDVSGETDFSLVNVTSPRTITGLVNRSVYSITVNAVNLNGLEGAPSAPVAATPIPSSPATYTNLLGSTDASGYFMYSFDLSASETVVNVWAQTDVSSSTNNFITGIYQQSSNSPLDASSNYTLLSGVSFDVSSHLIFDSSLNNVSLTPNMALTNLTASSRYYIVAGASDVSGNLSLGLEAYTGRNIPLTFVKAGPVLNPTTGLIASTDTSLSTFTIDGTPVINGDGVTLRNKTSVVVVAVANDPNATVDISGGSGLAEGSQQVTVVVTAADGSTTSTYAVTLNVLLATITTSTLSAITSVYLSPTSPTAVASLATGVLADISANPTATTTVVSNFLASLNDGSLSIGAQINVITNVSLQLPFANNDLKQLFNDTLTSNGVASNTAYDLSTNMIAPLVSAIPSSYKAGYYAPKALALILPDSSSNAITIDLGKQDLLLSLIPDVSYSLNGIYNSLESVETYTVIYKRLAGSRYLLVDGEQQSVDSLINFTFTEGPQRYFQLKAFGSPMGQTGPITTTGVCFLGNAPVLTPSGYKRIDSLQKGDTVTTADGRTVEIKSIVMNVAAPGKNSNPYIIRKGMYGATSTLAISPRHRIATPGGMVEAQSLGLQQMTMRSPWCYYNVELPAWSTDNLVVAGVEAESLAPTMRMTMTEFNRLLKAQFPVAEQKRIMRSIVAAGKIHADQTIDVPVARKM